MAKAPFMAKDDAGKQGLLGNFSAKLPNHAPVIGVTPEEVADMQASNLMFSYLLDAKNQYANKAQEWTTYKNIARDGGDLGNLPVAPVLADPPAAVAPGIFPRLSALAGRIKKHPGYTPAIGQDLQIIGAEQVVDTANIKPILTLTLQAGRPNVGWTKQGMDSIEIWVDRGDGKGFVFLAVDTVPDYLDTAALPAPGASAIWKYKGIYRLNDEQVGQWSDVASIGVMG